MACLLDIAPPPHPQRVPELFLGNIPTVHLMHIWDQVSLIFPPLAPLPPQLHPILRWSLCKFFKEQLALLKP